MVETLSTPIPKSGFGMTNGTRRTTITGGQTTNDMTDGTIDVATHLQEMTAGTNFDETIGTGAKNRIKAYVPELRIAQWIKSFKLVPIEKYASQTNPREWLQLYSMVTRLAGGDTFVMANYLPVCLEPAIRIWLMSPSERSITSWGNLNKKFIESFQATYNRPGNHFDLTRIKQKVDEPLRHYIKRFCAKKTKIPNVPNQQIIATFLGGVQSDELVQEIGQRNHDLKLIARECNDDNDKDEDGEFQEPRKEVNFIFGGPDAQMPT
ncbi:hypothetical protein PR202_gb27326 [Eleusine coracana subsp. coracana]|uniref:Retrotransposon gag domain-containing protein n=1 Tax=Eleusine coracana subsp. coracana TaxID=191504 RepID=A0AAV5FTG2_ELECO|nr:hypothetical protein PR202_gb27326 [Eleusine coracana subsp. coracana]